MKYPDERARTRLEDAKEDRANQDDIFALIGGEKPTSSWKHRRQSVDYLPPGCLKTLATKAQGH